MALTAEERRWICRQNGQKSTGPKTIAGKIKSSANAITHGLAGESLSLYGGDSRALRDKLDYWMEFYKPSDSRERTLIERAVLASSQQCRCLVAAHHHVVEQVAPEEAIAAILGCERRAPAAAEPREEGAGTPALALYRIYERRHYKAFQHAHGALLKSRTDAEATGPVPVIWNGAGSSGDADCNARQFGYY